MTKTFTTSPITDLPAVKSAEKVAEKADQQVKLFYDSIKPQLNELVKDPSDDVINRIMAYSKAQK